MKTIKILNLYAGIGGNRELWPKKGITAIENNEKIAKEYKKKYPNDKVITTDAHKYLLENFEKYDFIWSSPPCQSHSGCNNFLFAQGIKRYPDMKLYEEIIFLNKWCKGKWVVENVKPYYKPLISPQIIGRHYFWSNFYIPKIETKTEIGTFNRSASKEAQLKAKKKQKERNCVPGYIGKHILNMATKEKQERIIWKK